MPLIPGRRDGEAPRGFTPTRTSPAYTVPDSTEENPQIVAGEMLEGFSDEDAPQLRVGSEGTTPDDIRIGMREPPPEGFARPAFYHEQNDEKVARYAREDVDVDRDTIVQPWDRVPQNRPDQIQDKAPIRLTATQNPISYLLRRDWHIPRPWGQIYGEQPEREHVSMADHRRTYPILGMKPAPGMGMNTFRKDPEPWDQNVYVPSTVPANEDTQGIPLNAVASNRSYRLSSRA